MKNASLTLVGATASITLILAGFASSTTEARSPKPPSHATIPPELATILQDYNTAASQRLTTLAADFNSHLPSGVVPVLYLDYDKIATWFGLSDGPATVEQAIGDYLAAKTNITYDPLTLALLAKAMNALDPEGIVMKKGASRNCLVVPQYPGLSFHTAYAATFRLGRTDLLAGKTITLDLSTRQLTEFVDAHETWHCLDVRYVRDTGDGLVGAVKRNRAEMFADIGGAMEAVRSGADLAVIDKLAALHSAWSFVTGPAHAKMPPEAEQHFESIVYATGDGLDALKDAIEKMGLAAFRNLNREQLRALDYELTDKHCLTYAQAEALQNYFATGQAQAPARTLISRLETFAAATVRDATPAEQPTSAQSAAADPDSAQAPERAAEESLLQQLRARASQLASADSFANQLQARQEMTDALRAQLLVEHDPAAERATEAQLRRLFYTDAHLIPRPNGGSPFASTTAPRP